jgi:hypothetical protein
LQQLLANLFSDKTFFLANQKLMCDLGTEDINFFDAIFRTSGQGLGNCQFYFAIAQIVHKLQEMANQRRNEISSSLKAMEFLSKEMNAINECVTKNVAN